MAHRALSHFGNGLVVDIENTEKGQKQFEAVLWSDYPEEREYFFIGGLQTFHFVTMHHVADQQDYRPFVEVLMVFEDMIGGHSFEHRAIPKLDVTWTVCAH